MGAKEFIFTLALRIKPDNENHTVLSGTVVITQSQEEPHSHTRSASHRFPVRLTVYSDFVGHGVVYIATYWLFNQT